MVDIIDDDDAVRDSTRALLEAHGFEVRDYASAEQFLCACAACAADCILVDQQMPGMNGIDLLEMLRAKGDRRPALMVTGLADPALKPRLERVGAALLHKPVSINELLLWVERHGSRSASGP